MYNYPIEQARTVLISDSDPSQPPRIEITRPCSNDTGNDRSLPPTNDGIKHDAQTDRHMVLASRGRRQLNFVKCDQCRKDKQKCLPVVRYGSHPCDRCKEKDFVCSEGRKVQRMPRRLAHNRSSKLAPSALGITPVVKHPDTVGLEHCMPFLVLYRTILARALKVANELVFETETCFGQKIQLEKDLQKFGELNQFKLFFAKLSDCVLQGAIKQSQQPSDEHNSSILLAVLTWNLSGLSDEKGQPDISTSYYGATSDLDTRVCDRLMGSDNIAAHFIAHERKLTKMMLNNQSRPPTIEDQEALWAADQRVCEKAEEVLKAIGLWESMPPIARRHPSYISTSLTSWIDQMGNHGKNREWHDCLGRNILLRHADCDPSWLEKSFTELLSTRQDTARDSCDSSDQDFTKTLDQKDILGRSILHVACQKGLSVLVAECLIYGACPNILTDLGSSPLHYACASEYASIDICDALLSKGLQNLNTKDFRGNSPMHYADQSGHADKIETLLRTEMVDIPTSGFETLVNAVREDNNALVAQLLSAGADHRYGSESSLFLDAIDCKQVPCLHVLCEMYPDVVNESMGVWKQTPLTYAVSKQLLEGVEYLMTRDNIDVNCKDDGGSYPLHIAAASPTTDGILELLLQHPGIDLSIKDSLDRDILQIAWDVDVRNMLSAEMRMRETMAE